MSNSQIGLVQIKELNLGPTKRTKKNTPKHDVMICCNSQDAEVAQDIAESLRDQNIETWLDEPPNSAKSPPIDELERTIATVPTAVALWGTAAPWQTEEHRALIANEHEQGLLVVPVRVRGSRSEIILPEFLHGEPIIDLREGCDGLEFQRLLTHIAIGAKRRQRRRPVSELVKRLLVLLEQRHNFRPGSRELRELSLRIDPIVREIKDRFKPEANAIVAGAKLLRVVGVGNFGTIWEGEAVGTKERVAVKVFRLERLTEAQMLVRFKRSIKAMRLLSEKKRLAARKIRKGAIAKFCAVDTTGLAFSMQYLGGGNLENIARLEMTLGYKIQLILEICGAVSYAHSNGIIHRDIKPANIVLDDWGAPVLTDFDIADIRWATSLSTVSGAKLGTPVFAAPEQLVGATTNNERADERADVYSLGRLLHFVLIERSPGHLGQDPMLASLEGFPAPLVETVRRATQADPDKRYKNVAELTDALIATGTGWATWQARLRRVSRLVQRRVEILLVSIVIIVAIFGWGYIQHRYTQGLEKLTSRIENYETRNDDLAVQRLALEQTIAELNHELLGTREPRKRDALKKRLNESSARLEDIKRAERRVRKLVKATHNELRELRNAPVYHPLLESDNSPSESATVAVYDLGCALSPACANSAQCSQVNGRCVVTEQDCSNWYHCKAYGYCGFSAGACIVTEAGCANSTTECREHGRCAVSQRGTCIATTEGCKASAGCREYGRCRKANDLCVASQEGCAQSNFSCGVLKRCNLHSSWPECVE